MYLLFIDKQQYTIFEVKWGFFKQHYNVILIFFFHNQPVKNNKVAERPVPKPGKHRNLLGNRFREDLDLRAVPKDLGVLKIKAITYCLFIL